MLLKLQQGDKCGECIKLYCTVLAAVVVLRYLKMVKTMIKVGTKK